MKKMNRYYVEVCRPDATAEHDFAYLPTFRAALDWLLARQALEASLMLALYTKEPVIGNDRVLLDHHSVLLDAF